MERHTLPAEQRAWSQAQRLAGERIAFVPTMGALHEGHLSLVRLALASAGRVVVSVFVNPTQFGPDEDLAAYPRDLDADLTKLAAEGVHSVFVPDTGSIYPPGQSTWVVETAVAGRLEGASRPGHFRGVATVVTALLNITVPDLLVMGQKDAQQVAVIRRAITDLHLPVELVVGPTIRDPDGVALSSRNAYLGDAERRQAPAIHKALTMAQELVLAGLTDPPAVLERMTTHIESGPDARVDYVTAVDPDTFETLESFGGRDVLFCVAAFVGETRLIDNLLVQKE